MKELAILLFLLLIPGIVLAQDNRSKSAWAWATEQSRPPRTAQETRSAPKTATATLVLDVPRTANLWIQGEQQYLTGETVRAFVSPPLEYGKEYEYIIRVGDITRKVTIRAGETVRESFVPVGQVYLGGGAVCST